MSYSMNNGTHVVHASMNAEVRRRFVAAMRAALGAEAANGVAVFKGGESRLRHNTDHEYLFRQESYFAYLFGVREPDYLGAIDFDTGDAVLFMPKLDAVYATWMGALPTPDWVLKSYEVAKAMYVPEFGAWLKQRAPSTVFVLTGYNTDSKTTLEPLRMPELEAFKVDTTSRMYDVLSECRVTKTAAEIAVLRYACRISSQAHVHCMRQMRPNKVEYQMEADFMHYAYHNGGCREVGYTCIVGAGPDAAVLHYGHAAAPNNRVIGENEMCLLDMGAEYCFYGADITCSYPSNGKFTADQRAIYEAVLDANEAVRAAVKPGVSWLAMHKLSEYVVLKHLLALGVVQGDLGEMVDKRIGAIFQPHGLGHLLGIDTHDCGGIKPGVIRPTEPGLRSLRCLRDLEANMVITVEPGCYFIDHLLDEALANPETARFLVPERIAHFRGFGGVRIEDDIVVTATGHELLSPVPRKVEDIERVMAGGDWDFDAEGL